jgi:hypothetical protein
MKMTQTEMQTIAQAVRTLSHAGMLEVKIGKSLITAAENRPVIGPLTVGEITKGGNPTGELVYLLSDSSLPVKLDELSFRMTIGTPKKAMKAGLNARLEEADHDCDNPACAGYSPKETV